MRRSLAGCSREEGYARQSEREGKIRATETRCGTTENPTSNSKTFSVSPTNGNGGTIPQSDHVLNLKQGDLAVYGSYWSKMGDKCTMVISRSELMSYISDFTSVCWFLKPALEAVVRRLHRTVGNAVVDGDQHIMMGTGSTQLYQATLYALTSPGGPEPVNVVYTAPYYSIQFDAFDPTNNSPLKLRQTNRRLHLLLLVPFFLLLS
ncbi:hypothetical protein ACFX1Z_022542 [Malus domestica]